MRRPRHFRRPTLKTLMSLKSLTAIAADLAGCRNRYSAALIRERQRTVLLVYRNRLLAVHVAGEDAFRQFYIKNNTAGNIKTSGGKHIIFKYRQTNYLELPALISLIINR